jgi:hypothetical protein
MSIATLLRFSDGLPGTKRRYAVVALPSGEVCEIVTSRRGALVRKSIVGRFGRNLYREHIGAKVTVTALVLNHRFPDRLLPGGFVDFNLSALTNAVMHCRSCREVSTLFQQTTQQPDDGWLPRPWTMPGWMTPTN